ncbi:MAG: VOC family protein [Pseudomonadota bacterium]|nr:VOC family protein [Pseudomonadota bacterium]
MAKIKHLAIISVDPKKLALFYQNVFGLKILKYADNGSVFLTDGYLNLALLTNKAAGKPNGLNHFGFVVDNNEEIFERYNEIGMKAPRKRPADRHYAEYRGFDPDGNNFDLSENGFEDVRPDRVPSKKKSDLVS